jgi:hypothetical protein
MTLDSSGHRHLAAAGLVVGASGVIFLTIARGADLLSVLGAGAVLLGLYLFAERAIHR